MAAFPTVDHSVDLCVVGGGLSGLCAAVAAARHGIKVALMHERPMLGGNASSEVRMWVCGAHGDNNRETGIIEELLLENQYRNPEKNYSLWDTILYEKARFEPSITLLLNCTCMDAQMKADRVLSVTGWQMTTQRFHRVRAMLFADCSGDSVLAPLTGAEFRFGREGRGEFGESFAPPQADARTMGMSCLIQAYEDDRPHTFIPPTWANQYDTKDLPYRVPDLSVPGENFWYLEMGGEDDCIADTEAVRDELYKCALGLWDYVKNHPDQAEKNKNWTLDWMGMLPGKRESRRYVGDYIMTEQDVLSGGHFDDIVAYGGWTMDDHHPGGFASASAPTVYHPVPSPYGIPYRCLYSKNISNLLFAGRNISVTHSALSSTRVMATCALLGQAVGTAAALAARMHISPRAVHRSHMGLLRQKLMEDDCYLPFCVRNISKLTASAHVEADSPNAEALRNGIDRPRNGQDNGWLANKGESVVYRWDAAVPVKAVRLIFDSDLNRETLSETALGLARPMTHNRPRNWPDSHVPRTLVRAYALDILTANGAWKRMAEAWNNHQRMRRHLIEDTTPAVRLTVLDTWGSQGCHVFAMDVT